MVKKPHAKPGYSGLYSWVKDRDKEREGVDRRLEQRTMGKNQYNNW
jgi:hypothetical protein